MTGKVGFASKIFGIISDINVNLDVICQTHDNNHMSFVIDAANAEKTMNRLNQELFISPNNYKYEPFKSRIIYIPQ